MTRRRWLIPYLLLVPGLLWLALFFVLPNIQMFLMSLSERAGGERARAPVRADLDARTTTSRR